MLKYNAVKPVKVMHSLYSILYIIIIACMLANCTLSIPNSAPVAIIESSKTNLKIKEKFYITARGFDQNGNDDIVEYLLGYDKDVNDKIEVNEVILRSAFPILNYEFIPDIISSYKFYSQCTDKQGLLGIASLIVTVVGSNLPTATIPNQNLNESETKEITLPSPVDDDTSGEIPYTAVEVEAGNVVPVLIGNKLTLSASIVNENTPYKLKLTFGTIEGGVNTASLEGTVQNLSRITGKIESSLEQDVLKPGIVELYNDDTNELLGTTDTNDGNFEINANSYASKLRLEARLKTTLPNTESFRSVWKFNGTKDYSNAYAICVPVDADLNSDGFPDLDTDKNGQVSETEKDNFRTFARRLNFWPFVPGNGEDGLKKWNLGERTDIQKFEGVQIVYKNPASTAQFTETQRNNIENYIRTCGEQGVESIIITDDSAEKHYDIYTPYIIPKKGWLIIVPALRNSLEDCADALTTVYDNDGDGYIDRSLIYIDLDHVNKTVTSHEYKHGKGLVGHGNEDPRTGNSVPQIYYALMNQGTAATIMLPQENILDSIIRHPKYPAMKSDEEILKYEYDSKMLYF